MPNVSSILHHQHVCRSNRPEIAPCQLKKLLKSLLSSFTENSCWLGFSNDGFQNIDRNVSAVPQHHPVTCTLSVLHSKSAVQPKRDWTLLLLVARPTVWAAGHKELALNTILINIWHFTDVPRSASGIYQSCMWRALGALLKHPDSWKSEGANWHMQIKLPFNINDTWRGFGLFSTPGSFNSGLAFASQADPTSCSFKSEDEIKIEQKMFKYDENYDGGQTPRLVVGARLSVVSAWSFGATWCPDRGRTPHTHTKAWMIPASLICA